MKKLIYILFLGILLFPACSHDDKIDPDPGQAQLRLAITTQGILKFEDYIYTLTVYAFKEQQEEFRFQSVLAQLNRSEIKQLESAASSAGQTDAKLLDAIVPSGKYRIYCVANADIQVKGNLQVGITRPQDVVMVYPPDGFRLPYFLGQSEVQLGAAMEQTAIVLQRKVSELLVKLYDVPEQINSITLKVDNIADTIAIDGTMFGSTSAQELFVVKNQDVYKLDTVLFNLYTFPTLGTNSPMNLIFRSESGEEKIKTVDINLLPDRYLQIEAKINGDVGALLSFNVNILYFIGLNWRDIELPDFILKPENK